MKRNISVALLAGILVGTAIGGKTVFSDQTTAFMGSQPDYAKEAKSIRWLDTDHPRFRSPEPNTSLRPAAANTYFSRPRNWLLAPENCSKFRIMPRRTKCIMQYEEVKPTALPYPDKSNN